MALLLDGSGLVCTGRGKGVDEALHGSPSTRRTCRGRGERRHAPPRLLADEGPRHGVKRPRERVGVRVRALPGALGAVQALIDGAQGHAAVFCVQQVGMERLRRRALHDVGRAWAVVVVVVVVDVDVVVLVAGGAVVVCSRGRLGAIRQNRGPAMHWGLWRREPGRVLRRVGAAVAG